VKGLVMSKEKQTLSNTFESEIGLIESKTLRELIATVQVRPEFFKIAASRTHHDTGAGGLVEHTRNVVRVAAHICDAYDYATTTRDAIIAASLLHDICKPSRAHAYEAAALLKWYGFDDAICDAVRYHMGRWTPSPNKTSYKDSEVSKTVHLADYLASR
jgi:putative nucleotidyltransferase with HDIG domain